MATKSIIEIDVNDETFKSFIAIWSKYQSELKDQGSLWGQTEQGIDASVSRIDAMAKALARAAAIEKARIEAQKKADKEEAERDAKRLRIIKQTQAAAKGAAEKVGDVTRGLLKWASIGSIFSGLLGFGGLFGFEEFAGKVGDLRKQAMGAGVTPSELQASRIQLSTLLGSPEGTLTAITEATQDYAKMLPLTALGWRPGGHDDPFQIQLQMLQQVRDLLQAHPNTPVQSILQPRGLGDLISTADALRIRDMGPLEFQARMRGAQEMAAMKMPDQEAADYQNMLLSLAKTRFEIETKLVHVLLPLTGAVEKLGGAFGNLVTRLEPSLEGLVDDLAGWMNQMATEMGKDEFRQNVELFVTNVGLLADAAVHALSILGVVKTGKGGKKEYDQWHGLARSFGAGVMGAYAGAPFGPWGAGAGFIAGFGLEAANEVRMQEQVERENAAAAATGTTPASVLARQRGAENATGDPFATSPKGAQGTAQFMPATAAQYGVDVHDPASSARGQQRYMDDLLKMFHGNLRMAVAAYNWGPGNLMKDIYGVRGDPRHPAHGADWERFAPHETQKYLARILGPAVANARPAVEVTLNNNTAGNTNAQVTALGYPSFGMSPAR